MGRTMVFTMCSKAVVAIFKLRGVTVDKRYIKQLDIAVVQGITPADLGRPIHAMRP